jgi:hypothetical protein
MNSLFPMAHDGVLIGRCVTQRVQGESQSVEVGFNDDDGIHRMVTIACMDQVFPQIGDTVVMLRPQNADYPIVIGTLGSCGRRSIALTTGFSAEVDASNLCIRNPNGRVLLEIDTGKKIPSVALGEQDLSLDLSGRLSVVAKAIDLRATEGDVQIMANNDVVARGERIQLN